MCRAIRRGRSAKPICMAKFIRVTAGVLDTAQAEAKFADALTVLDRPAEFIREMSEIGGA
jgi:hypothetical protein